MKVIVISKDKTNRLNPGTSECLQAFRPSVVSITEYVKTLTMEDKIDVIAKNLPATARDEDFEKFYAESGRNSELAVQSFLAALEGNKTGNLDNEKAAEASADAASKAATATPAAKSAAGAK